MLKDLHIPLLNVHRLQSLNNGNSRIDTRRTNLNGGMNTNRLLMKSHLNKYILQQCLETFDIFKEINEDPIQKTKLMRDVLKTIIMKVYDEEGTIYNKGQNAESIYMVIKGSVSLCLPIYQQNENQESQDEVFNYQYKEIDIFEKGAGFGQAEFIVKKKRGLVAKAKEDNTVIGIIKADGFEEIIQKFRERIYLKKLDMFSRCPLLKNLQKYSLEFIVHNAKPVIFSIFKEIAKQKEVSKAIFLITQGQVELKKLSMQPKPSNNKYYTHNNNDDAGQIKIKNIVVGILQEGQFLGDSQLALGIPYGSSAIAKSQKVRAYVCDERIIMSQMNKQSFESASIYYSNKNIYHENKEQRYLRGKSKLQKQIQHSEKCILSRDQIKLKRRITNRYVQKIPSLIGQLSPRQIEIIVNKKYLKLMTQPAIEHQLDNVFPNIDQVKKDRKIKVNEKFYSPYLKKIQQEKKKIRKYSQIQQQQSAQSNKKLLSQNYSIQFFHNQLGIVQSEESKLFVPSTNPYQRKAQNIYERISRQQNKSIDKEEKKSANKEMMVSLSTHENRRLNQFKEKIRKYKLQSSLNEDYIRF